MNRPVFLRRAGVWPVRVRTSLQRDIPFRSVLARMAGQSSVEGIVIVVALAGGAVGLGLFGEDGGLASAFIDSLRRFQRGFGYALSLAG
jgi:hypothetical protein